MAENNNNSDVGTEEDLDHAMCVLVGSDPENCSYSRGYIKRQAVFACSTCTPDTTEPAGVCLACANKCHDGHDIFELYTKRNFRCDCGNSKFGGFRCHLSPFKDETNPRNQYNHNFKGLYCSCDRQYPDSNPQDEINDDEMIQCVVCEDWFHKKHLGPNVNEPVELEEMVCETCMDKAPFLWTYAAHYAAHYAVSPETNVSHFDENEDEEVDGEKPSMEKPATTSDELIMQDVKKSKGHRHSPCKRTHEEMTSGLLKTTNQTAQCKLKQLEQEGLEGQRQGAVFWPYSWRSELCTCTSCKRAYVAAEVQFLMDQSDTLLAYEQRGLEAPFWQNPLLALTTSMEHRQRLEVICGINELTTEIREFLTQCLAEGKSVTAEGVCEFFEKLKAKKKPRTN